MAFINLSLISTGVKSIIGADEFPASVLKTIKLASLLLMISFRLMSSKL
jgi:hypothetical protein